MGAEFIHGLPPELLNLVSEAGKEYFELDGRALCLQDGRLKDCVFGEEFSILRDLPEEPDLSFKEWIERQHYPPAAAASAISYVQGFNAADASVIGVKGLAVQQRAEDAIEGDRLFRVEEGYSALADYLAHKLTAAGGALFLSSPVHKVQWRRGSVLVESGSNAGVGADARGQTARRFHASRCIVTLPLGVLQAGDVLFDPAPRRALEAAGQLAMGNASRIVLVFRERFWEAEYPDASFLFLGDLLPSVWWTSAPKLTATLTGWVGGPRARDAAIATKDGLLRESFAALGAAFALPATEIANRLLSAHTHDWGTDPFSRGAYSYVPSGAFDAISALAEPLEDTLFFAGEHTDTTGHWGTVHGALRSGLRAAVQAGNG